MSKGLAFYVVYNNASDYPGEYVIRRHVMTSGTIEVDTELTLRTKEYADVLNFVKPKGLVRINRDLHDDISILETWL